MVTRTANVPNTNGLDGFRCFMREECDTHFPEGSSLADYILEWLWQGGGHGVGSCFGDFEIFLKTIPLIVDAWYRDPTILHYGGSGLPDGPPFERYATSAFGGDDKLHAIFDRDSFTAAVYEQHHSYPR